MATKIIFAYLMVLTVAAVPAFAQDYHQGWRQIDQGFRPAEQQLQNDYHWERRDPSDYPEQRDPSLMDQRKTDPDMNQDLGDDGGN